MAGGTPLGQMIVELGLDDVKFTSGISGVKSQLAYLKNELKTSQSSFSTYGKVIDGVKSPTQAQFVFE